MHQAVDQRGKVERDNVDLHADTRKILLDQGGHSLSRVVARIGDQGKLHRMPFTIEQLRSSLDEPVTGEQIQRCLGVLVNRCERVVVPLDVGGRDEAVGRCRVSVKGDAGQVLPAERP